MNSEPKLKLERKITSIDGLVRKTIGLDGDGRVRDSVVGEILEDYDFAIIGKNDPRKHELSVSLGFKNYLHRKKRFILERKEVVEFIPSLVIEDEQLAVVYQILGLNLVAGFQHMSEAQRILNEVKETVVLRVKEENGGGTVTLMYESKLHS